MSDDEYEDIVLDFEGNFDLDSLEGKQVHFIGLETDDPVLKIDSKFYKVDVKDSIGTRLVFEKNPNGELEFFNKTDKVITARRVMVKPK